MTCPNTECIACRKECPFKAVCIADAVLEPLREDLAVAFEKACVKVLHSEDFNEPGNTKRMG